MAPIALVDVPNSAGKAAAVSLDLSIGAGECAAGPDLASLVRRAGGDLPDVRPVSFAANCLRLPDVPARRKFA